MGFGQFNEIMGGRLKDVIASDPRASGGTGFDRLRFSGNDDLQDLEVFGVNERQDATTTTRGTTNAVIGTANRQGVEEDAARARGLSNAARDVAEGTFERQTRGLDLSDRQKKSAARRQGLTRALAEAGAGSNARRAATDNAGDALQAGFNAEDAAFGQELAGLTGLANAEGQRRVRLANEKAGKRAERNSGIGTAIGAGIGLLALFSSEELKNTVEKSPGLLNKLKEVRVDKWKYKDGKHAHVGPYAEEFNDTFGVNQENRGLINIVDALGVTMGAIKELDQKVEALNA